MEQQVLEDLAHENIIIFKQILFSNEHVFIEMEKVNAGTLESFIIKKKKQLVKRINSDKEIEVTNSITSVANTPDSSPCITKKPLVIKEEVASLITKDICNGLSQIHK